jgi:hypothetical protein
MNTARRIALFHDRHLTIVLAVAVLLLATVIGTYSIARTGASNQYFPRFGPALSFACGGQFADIMHFERLNDSNASWVIDAEAFLHDEVNTFDCSSLPESLEGPEIGGSYQAMHQYSLYLVGGIWRIFGPTWSGFVLLYGFMFGMTALSAYLIAKPFMNRWLAVGVSMVFISSGAVMLFLQIFRDFSKAPFILGIIAIMVDLVVYERSIRRIIVMSVLAGLLTGVGFGFRSDVLGMAPLFLLASVFWFSVPWRARSARRLLPAAVFTVVFLFSSFPILRAYSNAGFIYMTFQRAEGLVNQFNEDLELDQPYYDLGDIYNDNFSFTVITGYRARGQNIDYGIQENLDPHAQIVLSRSSNDYNQDVVRYFPADMLARAFAGIKRTSTLSLEYTHEHTAGSIWELRSGGANWLNAILVNPLWVAVLGAGIALYKSRRVGSFLILLIAYSGVVSTVQFRPHSVFHNEIWFWILGGIVLWGAWQTAVRVQDEGMQVFAKGLRIRATEVWTIKAERRRYALVMASGIAIAVGLVGSLYVVRTYQTSQVHELIENALDRRVDIPVGEPLPYEGDLVIYPVDSQLLDTELPVGFSWAGLRYLTVTFSPGGCDLDHAQIDFVHEDDGLEAYYGAPVLNRSFEIDFRAEAGSEGSATILFPAYYSHLARFFGIAMDSRMADCLEEVAEVPALGGEDLTPYFLLNPGWENEPAYLTIK